ncbi:MAG TPA: response regulator [Burkholderiaceae bacterium]|nr:response regulator [Burkholderiaceae bacterium]
MRILLVEDNRTLADWLARTLQRDRYAIDCVYNGSDADHLLRTQSYELVILDLGLPQLDGREVLRRLRRRSAETPVLILTANDSIEGRVESLDAGADDYLAKPFEVSELEARMRALMRRSGQRRLPSLSCAQLGYDGATRLFTVDERELRLTPREHALLEALMLKAGRTVSKAALAESVFSMGDDVGVDSIEVYVHRVRRKIAGSGATIITLRGLGYLLRSSDGVQ